jgi:peptidoglycan-associated lipoprotein
MSPAAVEPNAPVAARVFGAAFESGATVSFSGPTVGAGSEVRLTDSNTLSLTLPALPVGSYDVTVANPDGGSATLRGGLTVRNAELACRRATVRFAYDSAALDSSSRSALDGHAACWQSASGSIRVEGHADERGTTEYNVALGQRRADSVKGHMTRAGVAAGKVSTVSYGEERPVASGQDESAWSQNRRAEIQVID